MTNERLEQIGDLLERSHGDAPAQLEQIAHELMMEVCRQRTILEHEAVAELVEDLQNAGDL